MPVIMLDQSQIFRVMAPEPGKKRTEYCDKQMPGLYVEARQGSTINTYYLRYKDGSGKTCHQKLGRADDITLVDARKKAKSLKSEIAQGADPREDAKDKKAPMTLAVFFVEHYIPYKKQRKKWQKDADMWRLRIKEKFGHRPLNSITRQELQAFHTQLREEGLAAATCNHYIKLLRHAYNLALEWDLVARNPVQKIPLFYEDNKVEHYLDDDQLQKLLSVLKTDENRIVCNLALFLLSTGARLNEALKARWEHIDRNTRVWVIPSANSKSKKLRSVPLNDSAIDILDVLKSEGRHAELFISPKTKMPLMYVHKVWDRLRNDAGLPFLRIHDLRHNYASFLVNSGHTLYEVQHILGHSDPTVTQRYAHLSTKTLQGAADSASHRIAAAMKAAG